MTTYHLPLEHRTRTKFITAKYDAFLSQEEEPELEAPEMFCREERPAPQQHVWVVIRSVCLCRHTEEHLNKHGTRDTDANITIP